MTHTPSPAACYGIQYWSDDYFRIQEDGTLHAIATRGKSSGISLPEAVHEAQAHNLRTPLLIRFPDILRDRVNQLYGAYSQAQETTNYQGTYTAVYPIKVNQQRDVLETLLYHPTHTIGLEAGSKPELLTVLANAKARNQIIICNGYKDPEYIRYALIGRAMGHKVYIIIEKLSEVKLILDESAQLGIQPLLGLRVRLASIGKGKWQNTGGDKAKFGLSAAQVLEAIETLRQSELLNTLEVLHFHMGSQIANIRDIQKGLQEGARFYCELKELGAAMKYIDVGGGLGIDYEGTHSRSACSMNYTMEEYAYNVIKIVQDVCFENQLPEPHILTEVGRAMVAHHAVLVVDTVDREQAPGYSIPRQPQPESHPILHSLWHDYEAVNARTPIESYHEATHYMSEAQALFTHGQFSLKDRAWAEAIYFAVLQKIRGQLVFAIKAHRELFEALNEKLASKYFLNFSVFQSTPDIWAIEQIFPIMPISRLNENLNERGILQDLTCDSDGRIDYYLDSQNIEPSMPLPSYNAKNPYLLGLFLVGAYQETLGDIHNLFGDTDSVNASWDSTTNHFVLTKPKQGDSAQDVLRLVGYAPETFADLFRQKLAQNDLTEQQQTTFREILCAGLWKSTYLR